MAFAFGQNDLANAASPGLAGLTVVEEWDASERPGGSCLQDSDSNVAMFGCGVLMRPGMLTKYAQRVTRAEVNIGSQFDHVVLYAPRWCLGLARAGLRLSGQQQALAPPASLSELDKKVHYDTLRAS